ncbi:MAG: SRPBCC domain-containing protein [Gammaproteobacteria bacterium]|nr:SRPBCC domain-containing protein [Gammaproteobacteria bacterium]MDH5619878.1 SRPBCC domain-containing protein [Gammaproteobacteria bacterium]
MPDKKFADREVYKVLIKAPIETVWSELVNTTSPRPFFWNSTWDTREMAAGNAYRMISNKGRTVAVIGEILELDPPHRLVHSFRLTSLDDPHSTVTYALKETPEGTEFSLITENIVAGSKSEKSMADGSKFIVENFKSFVETGKVTFGARVMLAMFALTGPFAPKSMRVDKWPLD